MRSPYVDRYAEARALAQLDGDQLAQLDAALAALVARPAWQEHAACRGADPAAFFPERGASLAPARRLCATCPVSGPCGDYADTLAAEGPLDGLWAGVVGKKRKRRTAA